MRSFITLIVHEQEPLDLQVYEFIMNIVEGHISLDGLFIR